MGWLYFSNRILEQVSALCTRDSQHRPVGTQTPPSTTSPDRSHGAHLGEPTCGRLGRDHTWRSPAPRGPRRSAASLLTRGCDVPAQPCCLHPLSAFPGFSLFAQPALFWDTIKGRPFLSLTPGCEVLLVSVPTKALEPFQQLAVCPPSCLGAPVLAATPRA